MEKLNMLIKTVVLIWRKNMIVKNNFVMIRVLALAVMSLMMAGCFGGGEIRTIVKTEIVRYSENEYRRMITDDFYRELKAELKKQMLITVKFGKDAEDHLQIVKNISGLAWKHKELIRKMSYVKFGSKVVSEYKKLNAFVRANKKVLHNVWVIEDMYEKHGLYVTLRPLISGKMYEFKMRAWFNIDLTKRNFRVGDYVSIDFSHKSFPGQSGETEPGVMRKITGTELNLIKRLIQFRKALDASLNSASLKVDLREFYSQNNSNSADIAKLGKRILSLYSQFDENNYFVSNYTIPKIKTSPLSSKSFSVEGIEVFDILSSRNNGWKGAEVYVYTEHRTSGERRVFILTCKEKGVVSGFRDNLRLDTLVALSNFDKAIKGSVMTWLGRDYQEYYLDSVSDIAVVRERGSDLDEMWSVDVETGLER